MNGRNLPAGVTLQVSGTGITVVYRMYISDNLVVALLQIASNAATGPRNVSAATASGVSNALTFTVQ